MTPTVKEGKKIVVDGYHIPQPLKRYDIWVVWAVERGKEARAPWQTNDMRRALWAEKRPENPRRPFEKAKMVAEMPSDRIHETWPFPVEGYDPTDIEYLPQDTPASELPTVKPAILIPPASTENDLLFVDFDDVRDPETGHVSAEVWDILTELGGYVEVSSSGEGLHVWVRAELPDDLGKFIEPLEGEGQIEMYDRGRMTGGTWRHVRGTPKDTIPEAQSVVDDLVAKYETKECDECSTTFRARNLADNRPVCPSCSTNLDRTDDIPDRSDTSGTATVNNSSKNGENPYYQIDLCDVADTGPFSNYRNDSRNPAPSDWQGPHPAHGGTDSDDKESINFNIDTDSGVWHCFAHDTGGGTLSLIAVLENIVSCRNAGRVHANRETLLKACLAARDEYSTDLEGETPPYQALVAVAEMADLTMANANDGILGETAHRYAREIYAELSPSDV